MGKRKDLSHALRLLAGICALKGNIETDTEGAINGEAGGRSTNSARFHPRIIGLGGAPSERKG